VNSIVATFPEVTQFWSFDPRSPRRAGYSRDYPAARISSEPPRTPGCWVISARCRRLAALPVKATRRCQDHHFVGELEREPDVLLDEQDRLAFGFQAGDGAADLGDDERREAPEGSSIKSTRGLPISARAMARHLLLAAGERAGACPARCSSCGNSSNTLARFQLEKELFSRRPAGSPHAERLEDAPALRH